MKKVLLTTTALMMLGGVATAGSSSMSGSIALTYGAWGTGTSPGGNDAWTSEADLDVAASSDSGSLSMSGTLELDEGGADAGAVTVSTGGFSLTYDENAIGALALAPSGGDGEDDDYGDFSLSYTAGSLSATYVGDQATDDSSLAVSYTAGSLTLSMIMLDETDGAGGTTGVEKTTMGATYTTGPYTIAVSADDQDDQDWDASVAMASGDTTITIAADEAEVMSVAVDYAAGDIKASAIQEFNEGDATTFGLGYTAGAVSFGAAYDSGNSGYGSEAEMVVSASYTDGDVSVSAQANDQDESEVTISFSF